MSQKYGYVHPAKTAGSELRLLFDSTLNMVPSLGRGAIEHTSLETQYNKDVIWIGSVRNPYTRVYSIYNFFYVNDHDQEDFTGSFDQFCKMLPALKQEEVGIWRLQTSFDTLSLDGEVGVDHVIRFEHLNEDIEKLSKAVCTPLKLSAPKHIYTYSFPNGDTVSKRVYKNSNKAFDYSPTNAHLTRESRDIINELYAKDFEYFGYDKI